MTRRLLHGCSVGLYLGGVGLAALSTNGCFCTPTNVPGEAVIEVAPSEACPEGDAAHHAIVEQQGDIEEVVAGPVVTAFPAECCYADAFAEAEEADAAGEVCIDADVADVTGCPSSMDVAGIPASRAVVRWSYAHVDCVYEIIDHDWTDTCG